jgi:hypothetical protein
MALTDDADAAGLPAAHARFIRERRIPAGVARLIAGRGHTGLLRARAAAGDPGCAEALAEVDPDDPALEQFTRTGWLPVLRARSAALHGRGRTGAALAQLSPWISDPLAARDAAALLAAQGRIDEVFALLGPRHDEPGLAAALVDLAVPAGRGGDAVAALTPFAGRSWRVAAAVAADLERRGLVDAALGVLRPHARHVADQAARLLHRHERVADLRAWTAELGDERLATRLADLLERRGDVDGAAAVLEPVGGAPLAALYGRNGRLGDAVAVLTGPAGGDLPACGLYALGQIAPDVALDLIGERPGDPELFLVRVDLLAGHGRAADAIGELRARPDLDEWHLSHRLGDLLAGQGRDEEAIAALADPPALPNATLLAELLIRRGRVQDALDALDRFHVRTPR